MVKLENWAVCFGSSDPYLAPEQTSITLRGEVYGHARCADGSLIRTSNVYSVNGRTVKTANTTYELGKPNETYRAWVKSTMGYDIDENNPIITK